MTTTPYLELDDQATGANDNTWGDVADANFAILELAIARVLGIATTGGTTTLTSAQNRYPIINVTGILASNGIIAVKTQEKNFIVINNTTGAYTLTVKTASGTGKTIPRGRACKVYCDGTNVLLAREQAIPAAQAGGTVDAITATFEPAFIAAEIQDGTMWLVEAGGANTVTNPTFTPDGVGGGYTIKKNGAQALAAADIPRIGYKCLFAYDASGGHVELLNPAGLPAASATVPGIVELATDAEAITGTDTARAITPANLTAVLATLSAGLSAGDIKWAAYSATPSGFLPCNGAAVSRATYAALFTAISTTWGVGDGSTTFNVPDLRGRGIVGAGTGTVSETQAAANFATSDIITVTSNPQGTVPKWQTGMPVVVTTDGVLPTGISAATTYYVRRLSATTISLYDTLAHAIDLSGTTGIVNITNIGSGNHTLTCTLTARTLAQLFGHETSYDTPSHYHPIRTYSSDTGSGATAIPRDSVNGGDDNTTSYQTELGGDANGISNMPPSVVLTAFIKT